MTLEELLDTEKIRVEVLATRDKEYIPLGGTILPKHTPFLIGMGNKWYLIPPLRQKALFVVADMREVEYSLDDIREGVENVGFQTMYISPVIEEVGREWGISHNSNPLSAVVVSYGDLFGPAGDWFLEGLYDSKNRRVIYDVGIAREKNRLTQSEKGLFRGLKKIAEELYGLSPRNAHWWALREMYKLGYTAKPTRKMATDTHEKTHHLYEEQLDEIGTSLFTLQVLKRAAEELKDCDFYEVCKEYEMSCAYLSRKTNNPLNFNLIVAVPREPKIYFYPWGEK